MWAFRVLKVLLMLVGWLVIPVQLVTTFVLGILVSVTFGLLLFPMSLIWIVCFLGPLLGLSWVWEKAPFLRIPIAVVGIPLAFVGNIYACLMPSMGELDSRVSKLLLSESWPFSLDCWRLIKTRLFPESPGAENFSRILTEVSQKNKPYLQYLQGLGVTAPLPIDDNLREAEAETKRLRDLAEIVFQKEAQKARMEPQSEERTKAILAERVELKKRLRELGYKVNDDVVDNSDLEESEP